MSDLSIDLTSEGPARVVRLGGELDLASAPQLTDALSRLDGSSTGRLVIDLSDCEFIDSAGLAAILHGAQELSEAGGSVRIACPEGNLRDLLRMTAIDQSIPVVATRDEALAALGLGAA
jgi:anti-sigma B factor antagonist